MSTSSQSTYYLLWKGLQSGPFSLDVIREKLASGEVNRMHQVNHRGSWMMLGEFLDQQDRQLAAVDRETERVRQEAEEERRRAEEQRRQMEAEQMRREYETQLAEERAQQAALKEQLAEASRERVPSLANAGRTSSGYPAPEPYPPAYPPAPYPPFSAPVPTRSSGMAVAAFILSLCNFIPFVGFLSWILAIVFGHVALSNIKRDPTLGGRGLALAALIITYSLLVLGFIVGFVAVALGHSLRL